MHLRSFRTLLLFTCLLCPVILSGVRAVRAPISSTHQGRSFQAWLGINSTFFDSVTMWDDSGSRFIFSVLQSSAHTLWLSVAQQTDATGKFCNYSFPTLRGDDFDKLGVDSDGIYFSVNMLARNTVVNNKLFFITQASYINGLLTLDAVGAYDWGDENGPVRIAEWFVHPVFTYQDMIDWSESPTCFYGCGKEPMALYFLAG